MLTSLGTDDIDIFQLFWLGRTSLWRPSTVKALVSLRDAGLVRAIGVSIHDRVRAGRLAADSPLDMLMIRYNAAHTGAEQDIFPHVSGRRLYTLPEIFTGAAADPKDCRSHALALDGGATRAVPTGRVDRLERQPV